tara:strand:- start:239 stop:517 length:279 start_codon:yes stop_codon:yes gene_type:complete
MGREVMREEIKVIKENINFNQLPDNIQKAHIDFMADDLIESFDDGVHNKKTATIDAKLYYYDWNKDVKWVLYKSSFHGIRAETQEDFNREEY